MNKILVLTDFSDHSTYATNAGKAIAKAAGAKLILLHFIIVPSGWKKSNENDYPEIKKAARQAEAQFHMLEHEADKDAVSIDTKIIYDKDQDKLHNYISHREHDLVIIGSEGQNSLKKKILGSTAFNVLDNSKVPVLIIHKPFTEKLFNKILFPSDFDQSALEHFDTVAQLAKIFSAQVHLIHVMTNFPTLTVKDAEKRMKNFKDRHSAKISITTSIIDATTVEDGILAYQNRYNINLIAMVTHKYPWILKKLQFSVTEKLINNQDATVISLNVGKR